MKLGDLTPLNNQKANRSLASMNFTEAVKCLERPYIKIDKNLFEKLLKQEDNFYVYKEKIYTYGDADGKYALMPINNKAKAILGI